MFKNYLIVALRALRKQPGYTFINVAGLAVSMACCLFVVLYVQDELSYDRFHAEADRLYRIVETERHDGGGITATATTPPRMATTLANDFEVLEGYTRLLPYTPLGKPLISRDDLRFTEDRFVFADEGVFDLFSFTFISGDPGSALDAPNQLVLTASMASKYFGAEDPIGQTLTFNGATEFQVTGVIEDVPSNSHLAFDFLASFSTLNTLASWLPQQWHWPPLYTYIRLPEGYDPAHLEAQLPDFIARHLSEQQAEARTFTLQSVPDIHLRSNRANELTPNSDIAYVYLFSLVGLLILGIACINFVNLSTSRSMKRAREVGLRKVLGAYRFQLIRQFLSESVLTALLGLVAAVVLVELLLPMFNTLSGKQLTPGIWTRTPLVLTLIGIALVVGLAAGSYPAFYLSRFRPVRVLTGTFSSRGTSGTGLRRSLVVVQFVISSVLIIGTGAIYTQLQYLQNKNLGFDKDLVVILPLENDQARLHFPSYLQTIDQHPNVVSASASTDVPTRPGGGGMNYFMIVPERAQVDSLEMLTMAVGHDFPRTYAMDLLEGRLLSNERATDSTEAFLINETAAQTLGWDNPLDQELTLTYYSDGPVRKTGRVVGVLQDFHYTSLRQPIDPLVLHILPAETQYYDFLSVRITPTDVAETLDVLETRWDAFNPSRPFSYTFLDESFDALYRAEERLGRLFMAFSLLAVFVGCLGLFGLAAFTAEQRTKEIGVRKVLGASVSGVVVLLSRDFARLAVIAFVVACPIAYLAIQGWLNTFAYHAMPGPGVFLLAGALVLGIALLTVSYQAIKAARANPVDSLRYE